ncbi:hypothetical protein KP509_26G038000 [Ceratopteris richardii]|uniref:B30.2/SPRY domain-containing protein n=1 Tax=Ceratopteris richardii TaxID=49495 RepID=A0A8T2RML2_CERRI|nr:hypothetical protein KP509_26G038000 [Ceratopteris richardii]
MVPPVDNCAEVAADALGSHDFDAMRDTEDDETEDEDEEPTHIRTNQSLRFLVISGDKLSAMYTGNMINGDEVGVIQGDRPAPLGRTFYYFEVYVRCAWINGSISVGFIDERIRTRKQVGREPNTYGYHGGNGWLYSGREEGKPFGPVFGRGDIVGAGIHSASHHIFFTLNGRLVGSFLADITIPLYPSASMHNQHERVDVNFGQKPFVFDIEALERNEREKVQKEIDAFDLPLSSNNEIVRNFLAHHGYEETLKAFDAQIREMFSPLQGSSEDSGDKRKQHYAFESRKKLRQLTGNGDMAGACAYPLLGRRTDLAHSTSPPQPQSSLEIFLRQLTACSTEKWLLNGRQGGVFRLCRAVRREPS